MYKIPSMVKKLSAFIMAIIILLCVFPAQQQIEAASKTIRVRYNGRSVNFKNQQVYVKLDGKSLNMSGTPGLEMKDTYMVSYIDIIKKGLGAKCTYNNKTKRLVIQKYGKKITLKVGSRNAIVNGKKHKLSVAPLHVKYYAAKKTKLLVPARFVATQLGYSYSWVNNSSQKGTITMKTPFMLKSNNKWSKYTGTQASLTVNEKKVSMPEIPAIIIDGSIMIPVKTFITDKKVGGSYQYNAKAKNIKIVKGDNTVIFTLGKKTAKVNGKNETLSVTPRQIYNDRTKKTIIMVPAKFLVQKIGYNYYWNKSNKTVEVMKKNATYFTWKSENIHYGSDEENNQEQEVVNDKILDEVTASYKDKEDIIKLIYDKEINVDVNTTKQYVTVSLENAAWIGSDLSQKIEEGYWISNVDLNVKKDVVKIKIRKKSNSNVIYETKDGVTEVVIGKDPKNDKDKEPVKKNGIVIAVDCGHGANTAGKRTPPMPYDIDFDGDGVIDVKKGSSIREHQGNVGVGQYLVEELERCGFTVVRSAFGDTDISLSSRQALIKKNKADYSISIHFNAAGDGKTFNSAKGVEVLYHSSRPNDSKKMAQKVLNEMLKGTEQVNRGVKQQALALCNTSVMDTKASILVECAFMTNLYEARFLFGSSAFWKETAEDIARGVCNYTNQAYIKK